MAERTLFAVLVLISQVFGAIAVILMGIYLGNHAGGFGWGHLDTKKFNYHPLFMTIGLIFLYGDGTYQFSLSVIYCQASVFNIINIDVMLVRRSVRHVLIVG